MSPRPSQPVALRVRGLTMRFGVTYALNGVDLEVAAGDRATIVGPAGAGKTTLLNLMLGKLRHTAGRIEVLGLDPLRDATPLHARVAHVPNVPDVPRWMTLRELCEARRQTMRTWSDARATEWLQTFDLPEHVRLGALHDAPAILSMLTVAIASVPELLLLDGTFDALPEQRRAAARSAVDALVAETGCTVITTTADDRIAASLDGSALGLAGGRIDRDYVLPPAPPAATSRPTRRTLAGAHAR